MATFKRKREEGDQEKYVIYSPHSQLPLDKDASKKVFGHEPLLVMIFNYLDFFDGKTMTNLALTHSLAKQAVADPFSMTTLVWHEWMSKTSYRKSAPDKAFEWLGKLVAFLSGRRITKFSAWNHVISPSINAVLQCLPRIDQLLLAIPPNRTVVMHPAAPLHTLVLGIPPSSPASCTFDAISSLLKKPSLENLYLCDTWIGWFGRNTKKCQSIKNLHKLETMARVYKQRDLESLMFGLTRKNRLHLKHLSIRCQQSRYLQDELSEEFRQSKPRRHLLELFGDMILSELAHNPVLDLQTLHIGMPLFNLPLLMKAATKLTTLRSFSVRVDIPQSTKFKAHEIALGLEKQTAHWTIVDIFLFTNEPVATPLQFDYLELCTAFPLSSKVNVDVDIRVEDPAVLMNKLRRVLRYTSRYSLASDPLPPQTISLKFIFRFTAPSAALSTGTVGRRQPWRIAEERQQIQDDLFVLQSNAVEVFKALGSTLHINSCLHFELPSGEPAPSVQEEQQQQQQQQPQPTFPPLQPLEEPEGMDGDIPPLPQADATIYPLLPDDLNLEQADATTFPPLPDDINLEQAGQAPWWDEL